MPGSHDKIIADAARAALGPLGFNRKGRSRIWLADHGWWLTVVEFQPSSWSKGSYLNVAAHWLWSEIGTLSFDFGGRIAEHVQYLTDAQFSAAVAMLAETAAGEAQRLADIFDSLEDAAKVLLEQGHERRMQGHTHPGWDDYNAGVAAALIGRAEDAMKLFARILNTPAPSGSVLHEAAKRMAHLAADQHETGLTVTSLINRQREALTLPPLAGPPFQ